MISKDKLFQCLTAACPSFQKKWDRFVDEWKDEPKGLPIYLALSEFARHLIEMLERSETRDFPQIFAVIEQLHVEGDSYVQEAITIGFLEDLQNTNLYSKTTPEDFLPFLLPETMRWWNKLDAFWNKRKPE